MSLFITLEGTEGSGKTTQLRLLADALQASGFKTVVTREPGGTELGEAVRRLLLESNAPITSEAEAYLMTGARAQHVHELIRPALDRGATVICDRFLDSTLAYQGAGRGLPIDQLRSMQTLAVNGCLPHITFLLDLPATVGLERRRGQQGNNRIDREADLFHERVVQWYRQEAVARQDRWVIVDATQPPQVVHTVILEQVMRRLSGDRVVPAERSPE